MQPRMQYAHAAPYDATEKPMLRSSPLILGPFDMAPAC